MISLTCTYFWLVVLLANLLCQVKPILDAGRFFEYSATILFVVLLILLGKGYTITRGRIRPLGVIKLLVFTAVFIVATIAMFIWEATVSCLILTSMPFLQSLYKCFCLLVRALIQVKFYISMIAPQAIVWLL